MTFKRNLLIPASVWTIIYPDDEGSQMFRTTQCHIPEDRKIHSDCHLHLQCNTFYWCQVLR